MNSFHLVDPVARIEVYLPDFSRKLRTAIRTVFPRLRNLDIRISADHFTLPEDLTASPSDWQNMGKEIAAQNPVLHGYARRYVYESGTSVQLFKRRKR